MNITGLCEICFKYKAVYTTVFVGNNMQKHETDHCDFCKPRSPLSKTMARIKRKHKIYMENRKEL